MKRGNVIKKSEQTDRYNCLAFAVGDIFRWYWPIKGKYWPKDIPYDNKLETLIALYKLRGFVDCGQDGSHNPKYDKIALYVDEGGLGTHAAIQVDEKWWHSKLGRYEDIYHTLEGLEGDTRGGYGAYGKAVRFMKKRKPPKSSKVIRKKAHR